MSKKKDSFSQTILVALATCLVASVIVCTAAVYLKPIQAENRLLDKQSKILAVAGFDMSKTDKSQVAELFANNIETRILDFASGEFTDKVAADDYDQQQAAKDPSVNMVLTADQDIANIRTRAPYAPVYMVKNSDGSIKYYILPVHGYGLWSTMYGFLAIEADANTVYGMSFYDHGETPGLGGEVDNPKWKALWQGKILHNQQGDLAIQVVRYGAVTAQNQAYSVDGLAGASLTTFGINHLVQFWLGDLGYAPFLKRIKNNKE